MKKIIYLLLIILLGLNNQLFAATSEEDTCIKLLSKEVKNDGRFNDSLIFKNNKGLKNVLYNENNSSYIDISNYNSFTGYLVTNPASTDTIHQNLITNNGFTNKDFIARRTNIATVIASNNYVISNIMGFGKNSNFDFPLTAKSGNSYGDPYKLNLGSFKEYVVYTHHSYAGDFLSCGIVHVKPLGTKINGSPRGYGDINENGYKTNVLNGNNCSSGFQGKDIIKNGFTFYRMRTNVCVTNYLDEDYLKMEVISLAYKNGSSYFSDYVAQNLQVQAMKDLTNQQKGLYGIRQIFLRYLHDGSCLRLLHTSISDLPAFCGGNYSDNFNLQSGFNGNGIGVSDINASGSTYTGSTYSGSTYIGLNFNTIENNITQLFDMFLPEVNAFRKLKNMDELKEKARGIAVLDNIPYNLYIKLQNIKDKNFRIYLINSINPHIEDLKQNKIKRGIVLTPYEDIFLKCNISYPEREKIVIDFLKKLKDPNNIDYSNLSYINPKFGNCIIPYPDKQNLEKEVDLSFASNKILAKKLNGTYKYPEVDKEFLKLLDKEKFISLKYQEKIDNLTKKFNSSQISSDEFKKEAKKEKSIYDEKIKILRLELEKENKKIKINKKVNNKSKNLDKKSNTFNSSTIIIILLVLLGLVIIFFSIKKKK